VRKIALPLWDGGLRLPTLLPLEGFALRCDCRLSLVTLRSPLLTVAQLRDSCGAAQTTAEVIRGNPLLLDGRQGDPSFEIKRRWDDDVVFKNQV